MSNIRCTRPVIVTIASIILCAAPSLAQTAPTAPTTTTIERHITKVGDKEIVIELRDGQVTLAQLNGHEIAPELLTRVGDKVFQIRSPEGEADVIVDFNAGGAGSADPRTSRFLVVGADGPFTVAVPEWPAANGGAWASSFRTQPQPVAPDQGDGPAPKVMIGVQMSMPSTELAGHLGINPAETTLVAGVYPDLPADAAGLEQYDVIIAVNGEKPAGGEAVRAALADAEPGDILTLTVLHRGEKRDVEITLAEWDEKALSQNLPGVNEAVQRALEEARKHAAGHPWAHEGAPSLVIPGLQGGGPAEFYLRREETGDLAERLKRVEEQLQRLEETLGRLADQNERKGEGRRMAPAPQPPGPPALPHDETGWWEHRA